MTLEKTFPTEYFSKYSMVTFNKDIPYHQAMIKGRAQDKAILNMIADNEISMEFILNGDERLNKEELKSILAKVKAETDEILDEDKVARTMRH
jgi:kynurenine 3-monooxygenase